jgi:hypothetical protein
VNCKSVADDGACRLNEFVLCCAWHKKIFPL